MANFATLQDFEAAADVARDWLLRSLRLKEIRLPEGDVGSINIGWSRNGAAINIDPVRVIAEGFDGIRLIGAGRDRTFVRCTSYDGRAITVSRGNWVVEIEQMTVIGGSICAVGAGEQNAEKVIFPKFMLRLRNGVRILTMEPSPTGGRGKWGVFTYQCDLVEEDVEIDVELASEHGTYTHGFAKAGALVRRLRQRGSGAEGWKARPDDSETAWLAAIPFIIHEDSIFQNWHQPWSDRGGAATVLQASGAHFFAQRNQYLGGVARGSVPSNMRSKCVMISGESNGYNVETGTVGDGAGNGYAYLRRCLFKGYSEVDWHNQQLYVASNDWEGVRQRPCLGVVVEECGMYGRQMIVQLDQIPASRTFLRSCNTPVIAGVAAARGIDVTYETTIPLHDRRIPVSDGLIR